MFVVFDLYALEIIFIDPACFRIFLLLTYLSRLYTTDFDYSLRFRIFVFDILLPFTCCLFDKHKEMAHCAKCNSSFHEDGNEQVYNISDIDSDITSIIEQQIGVEFDITGVLCETCFYTALEDLQNIETLFLEEVQSAPNHDTYVCIWCRSALFHRRTHSLPEGAERFEISRRIFPRQIPDGALVCYSCWVAVQRIIQNQESTSENTRITQAPNINVCVWCQASLVQRRSHTLPEGPERNEVLLRIHPREIPSGGRVCYACWVRARRNAPRPDIVNQDNPEHAPQNLEDQNNCVWCRSSLIRRRTHILRDGPERHEIAARIFPREIPSQALVCADCWARIQHNMLTVDPMDQNQLEPIARINLDEFSHTPESSRCFVPGCHRPERLSVPDYLRKHILTTKKIFITESARVCAEHQTTYNWDILDEHIFNHSFTKDLLQAMLNLSITNEIVTPLDFENLNTISDPVFKYWTGFSKLQFSSILNETPMLSELSKQPNTALGIYLMKSRTGESHDRIASLFEISKSSVCRILAKARHALKEQFVPLHLGANHLDRDTVSSQRNLLIPRGLYGDTQNTRLIIICDGTYVYLQKSSNYNFQKKTYSLHKYRNLVKPFLLVTTDGHILDIFGPYGATVSDAVIMKALFQNENSELRNYFRPNDVFILDRGFRDSIPFLQSIGYIVHKPESLEEGETQLSTIKANVSRCVTLCRWVVEVVNGRFKRDFKLFRSDFFNLATTHLMDDFRICGALINAFHPEIEDRPDAESILNRALERLHMPNYLSQYIIDNNINRRRAQFISVDEEDFVLDIFPQMTMSDLILFALGTYQIKQARSYFGEHKRQHGSFAVEISSHLENINIPGPFLSHNGLLLRGRIRSRHQSNKIYYTYILLKHYPNWEQAIDAYYCSCICGKRTVGCCAHVMTMVWFFGWARHEENIHGPASFLDGILVRDDIENEEE